MKELDKEKIWSKITADESYPHFADSRSPTRPWIWVARVFAVLLVVSAIITVLPPSNRTITPADTARSFDKSPLAASNDIDLLSKNRLGNVHVVDHDSSLYNHTTQKTSSDLTDQKGDRDLENGVTNNIVEVKRTDIDDKSSLTTTIKEEGAASIELWSSSTTVSDKYTLHTQGRIDDESVIVTSSESGNSGIDLDQTDLVNQWAESSDGTDSLGEKANHDAAINDQGTIVLADTYYDDIIAEPDHTDDHSKPLATLGSSTSTNVFSLHKNDTEELQETDASPATISASENLRKRGGPVEVKRTKPSTVSKLPSSTYPLLLQELPLSSPTYGVHPILIDPLANPSPHSLWLAAGIGLHSVGTTDPLEAEVSAFLEGQQRRSTHLQLGYRYDRDKYFAQVGLGLSVLSSVTSLATRRVDYEENRTDDRLEKIEYLTTYRLPHYLQQSSIDLSIGRRFEFSNLQWSIYGGVQYQADHSADGRILDRSTDNTQVIDVTTYEAINQWSYLAGIQIERPVGRLGSIFCKAEMTTPYRYVDPLGRNQRITTGRLMIGYRFQF